MDGVECGGRQVADDRLHLLDRTIVLAGGIARPIRRDASNILFLHGADRWRPVVDGADHGLASGSGLRHWLCGAKSRNAVFHLPHLGAALRSRWRQLCFLHGQYQLLLPQEGEGQRARSQCWSRQSRRQRGAVRRTHSGYGRRVRRDWRRRANGLGWHAHVAAERRLHLGAVPDRHDHRCLGWHE